MSNEYCCMCASATAKSGSTVWCGYYNEWRDKYGSCVHYRPARSPLRLGSLITLMLALMLALSGASAISQPVMASSSLQLEPPPFALPANRDGTDGSASFLEEEAGLAAYTNIGRPIDLKLVRTGLQTVERETNEYLVGSVRLTDYPDVYDTHVYAHVDGWLLAYHLKRDPSSKIMDLRHYNGMSIDTTVLELAMKKALTPVGASSFTTTYYDFRSPNATHLMLIAKYGSGCFNVAFEIQLPSAFTFYERSYAQAFAGDCKGYSAGHISLDGVLISKVEAGCGWGWNYGTLTEAQLAPYVLHKFDYGAPGCGTGSAGLTLVYRETR